MYFFQLKGKKSLLLFLFLFALASCKQSEFYDKAALLESGPNAKNESDGGVVPTGDSTVFNGGTSGSPTGSGSLPGTGSGSGSGSGTTTSSGSPAGSTTSDPGSVVVAPPSGGSDVLFPPIVITPPVVSNPPVVTNPPADTTIPGVVLNERIETFTQAVAKSAPVDILWIVDDSGSMADNQDALARNFNSFINQFLEKDIDFKMAITTTDGTSLRNGKMVGDSSMLTHAAAIGNRTAFTNNFTKWIKVGTSGSGIEQGLKTASAFLDRYSDSYLRSDAYFVMVFVSDEEDQSDKKVSEYLQRFQSVKLNKGMVKAYSIVTQKLPPTAQWESLGLRYNEVAKATGGLMNDITSDFAVTLNDIGGSIVKLLDSFALAESPYDNAVSVFVNSVQVNSGWVFDIATHSLKFNADSLPAAGSKIEVHYKVKATVLGAI